MVSGKPVNRIRFYGITLATAIVLTPLLMLSNKSVQQEYAEYSEHSIIVTAIVEKIDTYKVHRKDSWKSAVYYSFYTPNGKPYSGVYHASPDDTEKFAKSGVINIMYDPSNPVSNNAVEYVNLRKEQRPLELEIGFSFALCLMPSLLLNMFASWLTGIRRFKNDPYRV